MSFKNGIFVFSPNIIMLTFAELTLKMIWEPLNCGSFLEKVYLRLHEYVLKISLKIVYERI